MTLRSYEMVFDEELYTAVASERTQHCGDEARAEGPKLEGLSRDGVIGEGAVSPIPTSYRDMGERCKLPQWDPGRRQEFWCILGSSGELSCSPAITLGSHE